MDILVSISIQSKIKYQSICNSK